MPRFATDLGPGASATAVLRALDQRARLSGSAPPAALIGDWLDSSAVIAPSIAIIEGRAIPDSLSGWWFGAYRFDGGVVGGITEDILRLDARGHWWYESASAATVPEWVGSALPGAGGSAWVAEWTAPEKQPHLIAIEHCLDAIRAGEVYQACVCTAYRGSLRGTPVDFFTDGADTMSSVKSAYLQGDWGAIASFSPETFIRRRGDLVESSPIKGTLPASADPAELRASVKDVAENIMIVDLVRNDFGRVAIPGSVTVPELLSIHPAPGVWHLVSTVQARLRPATTDADLLAATFPPASVTGTPKRRAVELLHGWEQRQRDFYCGAIGIATAEGIDLNVAIRTVEIAPDGSTTLGVGGGITIDSIPEREWQECRDKAASILALTAASQPAR